MTMTETPIATPKPKKPARRRRARRAAPAPKPPARVPAEFDGLTPTECCNACDEKHCVISGINVCAHPYKGGLQSAQQHQPEVVKRYRRAKTALAGAKLDLQKMAGG